MRKMLLQARIAVRRHECAAAASVLAQPLSLVDRGINLWRQISPLVKMLGIPVLLVAARKLMKHSGPGKLSGILGALPVILRAVRMMKTMRQARAAAAAPSA